MAEKSLAGYVIGKLLFVLSPYIQYQKVRAGVTNSGYIFLEVNGQRVVLDPGLASWFFRRCLMLCEFLQALREREQYLRQVQLPTIDDIPFREIWQEAKEMKKRREVAEQEQTPV